MSQTATCTACGQEIIGAYWSALGGRWHPHCFRCVACGQVIEGGKYSHQGGKPYHLACHAAHFAPTCARCGEKIVGPGVRALEREWHSECFVCARCGRPFERAEFTQDEGKPLHLACYHAWRSPPCAVCGQAIQTRSYVTNAWGDSYCEDHPRHYPACHSCGRLICERLTDGGVRYDDGRHTCNLCRMRAVDRVEEGEAALREVRRLLAAEGLDLGEQGIPVKLVDQRAMAKLGPARDGQPLVGLLRVESTSSGGREVSRAAKEMLILHGLPRDHFAAVAAHELCHGWVALNRFPELPPEVEEGLACLAEYLWLRQQEGERPAFRLKQLEARQDPVYGRGFKSARQAWEQVGMADLLAEVRARRRFPGDNVAMRLIRGLFG